MVKPSAPVHVRGHNLPTLAGPDVLLASPLLDSIAEAPINEDFLQKLYRLIENLPASIPEASDYDHLAVFSGNPADYN